MSNIVEVPPLGEPEASPEVVNDYNLDMILCGMNIPSQAMGKALAREVKRLRAQEERQ